MELETWDLILVPYHHRPQTRMTVITSRCCWAMIPFHCDVVVSTNEFPVLLHSNPDVNVNHNTNPNTIPNLSAFRGTTFNNRKSQRAHTKWANGRNHIHFVGLCMSHCRNYVCHIVNINHTQNRLSSLNPKYPPFHYMDCVADNSEFV